MNDLQPVRFSGVGNLPVSVRMPVSADDHSIAICLTLYNENISLFQPTLVSIIASIDALSVRDPRYRRAMICVVVDGRAHVSMCVRSYLATFGLVDATPEDQSLAAAISECQLDPGATDIEDAHPLRRDAFASVPITLRVIEKVENVGKLDSHWWFYQTVCTDYNPSYCFQVDTGTVLAPIALTEICATFDTEPDTAAIAGNILTAPEAGGDLLYDFQCGDFAVQKAIRWPSEILSGYLSVIPGQFSGVRWSALSRDIGDGTPSPKDRYLRGRTCETATEKMMYLAEDRVLGVELLTHRGAQNQLQYAPYATCHTDACDSVEELLKQRRRWLNGNMICRMTMITTVLKSVADRSQSASRRMSIAMTVLNLCVQHLLEWFLPLVHVLLLAITWHSLTVLAQGGNPLAAGAFGLIALVWVSPALLAVTGQLQKWPKARVQWLMRLVIVDFLVIAGINVIGISQHPALITYAYLLAMPFIIGIAVFLSALMLNRELIAPLRRSILPFVMLAPALWLMLSCFAFFNLHDGSWGTKGLSQLGTIRRGYHAKVTAELRRLRLGVVFGWLASNLALGGGIIAGGYLASSIAAVGALQVILILSGLVGVVSLRAKRVSRSGKGRPIGSMPRLYAGRKRNQHL